MSQTTTENALATPVGITLERYIMRMQAEFPYATGELSQLLHDITLAGKIVNRAGLLRITGAMGEQNVQGEAQQKLDVEANIRFIRALTNGGEACAVLSEENEEIIQTGNDNGKYVVAIDPLDGSSNIDVNVSIGTIFGIYRRVSRIGGPARKEDFLQGGRAQIAAGYILYGSSTMLVNTTGHGVTGFTYENALGEFFLSHPDIKIPQHGPVFSCNEGNWFDYPEFVRTYLTTCKKRRLTARYVGSLVADYHRNLFTGGIYFYPPTVDKSGGMAVTGADVVLDVPPTADLHQRAPLFVGSADLVKELQAVAAA
ncbi:class 1 fructose-bisphosphatase [Hymenobacter siberiensis]|uniref:class 1 fructose-bisphosphatase n=1 Tax=Hymenobacter siberiensis TaxID=2848396 RepID=UPI001C1E6C19|nr:class 1 fructose-bisphosphatase [Hymenobacter siberiensis]